MSGKSIKPLQAEACYYAIASEHTASDRIHLFFSRLFSRFHVADSLALWQECSENIEEIPKVAVLDLRGSDEAYNGFFDSVTEWRAVLTSHTVLALCERDKTEKLSRMASEGVLPQYFLMIPWKQGTVEKIIDDLRNHTASFRHKEEKGSGNIVLQQLNKGGNREYIDKLNAANSFYADHARNLQLESGRLMRLLKNMAQEESIKEISAFGRLIQYAEVIDYKVNELVHFSTQNWHTYQHQTTLDINTVLDAVSSTSIPFLKEHGIELIFEVSNNVPARLKGYPLGMIHVLVTVLELLAHSDIQGKLIMRVFLEKEPKEMLASLYVQFMQSHYRGSVSNIVLETIRKDHRFNDLLKQMDEIDGTVLHADSQAQGDILQLGFAVQMLDRRSYRLPSKEIMEKSVLIIDDRRKNAEILQKMLQYFHLSSTVVAQLDEAIMEVEEHHFDVVIVTERLAKRCAKNCKRAQKNEKFIVVNNGKGMQSSYLGLDLADSFLGEPYTHKGIFNAIVDVFSDASIEGRMEDVTILKSYLGLLGQNRRIAYIGSNAVVVRSMETFLEGTGIKLEVIQEPGRNRDEIGMFDFVLCSTDIHMLRGNTQQLESYLEQGRVLSKDQKVICVVPEEIQDAELEMIASFDFVITYLQEPIDPEIFYKILLDWAMEE